MMTALQKTEDRYLNDVAFHTLVNVIARAIEELQLTPSEVREAAMYAAYRTELRRAPQFLTPNTRPR